MMLCCGITTYGRIPLVIVDGNLNDVRYRDEILQQQRYSIHSNSEIYHRISARQRTTIYCSVMMDRLEFQCTAMPCRFDNARTSHTAE